jgi:hypothetical protein
MKIQKISGLVFLPLLLVSVLSAQSVAELARKEKERRAAVHGKKIVVTNDDLSRVKKKPAISGGGETVPVEEVVNEGQPAPKEGPPAEQVETPPAETEGIPAHLKEINQRKAEIEEKSLKATEMVDLLTTKMNALWQEFYNITDTRVRDQIEKTISDTYAKLQQAQAEADKAKAELDTVKAAENR